MSPPGPSPSQIDRILDAGIILPPVPDVLLQLERLFADPDAEPRQYAAQIQHDAMLSGAMFRVAHSPLFNLGNVRIDSLDKAVLLLGSRTTMTVARSECLRQALADQTDTRLVEILWHRSSRIAEHMLAAHNALRPAGVRPDLAYLLGIFHDCGIALIARQQPEYGQLFFGPAGWPDLASLDAACGFDHALVGERLARNWKLPDELALATLHHHRTGLTDAPETVRSLVALLQLGTHLYHAARAEEDVDWPEQLDWVRACLDLAPDALAALEEASRASPAAPAPRG